jgi:hypothetical protein
VSVTPEPELFYTPFVPTRHNYYTVAIQGMSLQGRDLGVKPVSLIHRCLPAAMWLTVPSTASVGQCASSYQYTDQQNHTTPLLRQ